MSGGQGEPESFRSWSLGGASSRRRRLGGCWSPPERALTSWFPRTPAGARPLQPVLHLSQQSHVGEALPAAMVTRLYNGMRQVDPSGRAQGPRESVSREQFSEALSLLLRGSAQEKSLVVLKMVSASEGPVKAREVQKVRPVSLLEAEDSDSGRVVALGGVQLWGALDTPSRGQSSRTWALVKPLCRPRVCSGKWVAHPWGALSHTRQLLPRASEGNGRSAWWWGQGLCGGGAVTHGATVPLQFAEDLVDSVAHVLTHRQELRGWAGKVASGAPVRAQALAAQLVSEMRLPGERPLGTVGTWAWPV